MIDGEIELKDKIFIIKNGTELGIPFVNYRVDNCLFILNTSKQIEERYQKWQEEHKDDLTISTTGPKPGLTFKDIVGSFWLIKDSCFYGVRWTDFKRRWKLIDEAQKAGKTLSTLDSELIEEDEISISNKIVAKSW